MLFNYVFILLLLISEYRNSEFVLMFSLLTYIFLFVNTYLYKDNFKKLELTKNKKLLKPFLIFCVVVLISFARTNNDASAGLVLPLRVTKFLMFLFLTFNLFQYYLKRYGLVKNIISDKLYLLFIAIPLVFVVINLFLYIASLDLFNNANKGIHLGPSVSWALIFGGDLERVNFPLVIGQNNMGIYTGGVLTLALTSLYTMKKYKLFIGITAIICLVTLLMLDTRSALIMSFASSAIVIFFLRIKKPFGIKFLIIIGSLMPILLLLFAQTFSNNAILNSISRGDDDITTGNSRLTIWVTCLNDLMSFKPIQLIGYGEFGQAGSGIVNSWADDFSDLFENYKLTTTHNLYIQTIYDIGYLGLIAFIYFCTSTFSRLKDMFYLVKDKNLALPISFILFFLLVGGTEAPFLQIVNFHLFWYVMVFSFSVLIFYQRKVIEGLLDI